MFLESEDSTRCLHSPAKNRRPSPGPVTGRAPSRRTATTPVKNRRTRQNSDGSAGGAAAVTRQSSDGAAGAVRERACSSSVFCTVLLPLKLQKSPPRVTLSIRRMLQVTVWASTVEDEGFGRSQTSRERSSSSEKPPLAVTALADPPHAHPADVLTHLR